jgi:ubiquinone biosynthesis protein Coq4
MGFQYLDKLATKQNLQALLELADLAAGAGQSAQNAFELSHRLRKSKPMACCLRFLERNPACMELIKQRKLIGPYDPDQLLAMPKGSLGYIYASALEAMGYDINFFPEPGFFNNLETDADYVNYRVFATHDIHHILTGFSLDGFGEVGVISVSVGQFNHPGFGFLDLVTLLTTWLLGDTPLDDLQSPKESLRSAAFVFGMINRGLEMSLEAMPLFPVIWEDQMGRDLEELRAELGIKAVKNGPYSWYSNPQIMAALA